MALALHSLAPKRGSRPKKFRIGRGHGSGRGKTAGRGTKGQRSRTGGRNKLQLKAVKQMVLSFPKLRGFHSLYQKAATVRVEALNRFENGTTVDLKALRAKGFLTRSQTAAKIVGGGVLSKKLSIKGLPISAAAKAAIEKAGGTVA